MRVLARLWVRSLKYARQTYFFLYMTNVIFLMNPWIYFYPVSIRINDIRL